MYGGFLDLDMRGTNFFLEKVGRVEESQEYQEELEKFLDLPWLNYVSCGFAN